ncbi:MAG: DUF2281 domain-containing protein [Calditrichaeota bacterium]|nr:DUF2281 domain-containing protein [Calditrichota bacterium]
MKVEEIIIKLKKFPDHLKQEVLDYIEFLSDKYGIEDIKIVDNRKKFQFDWEGGLSNLRKQYTSVELQHKAMDWR